MPDTPAVTLASRHAQTLSHYSQAQTDALRRLYELIKRHPGTGGGNAAAKLLLGLYNGRRFPFDLTDLRSFDSGNFEAAMTVIRMDARQTYVEVHVLLDAIYGDGRCVQTEFENWAYNLRLKGAVKKAALPQIRGPRRAVEFEIDGVRTTMAAFLAANADDEAVLEWAAHAKPGDYYPGPISCRAVAAGDA